MVGSTDVEVSDEILDHLLAVVRESLSNVSRHAKATDAEVVVQLEADNLELSVADNGVGLPVAPAGGDRLSNMAERAGKLGGSFTATRNPSGTVIEWKVPLRH